MKITRKQLKKHKYKLIIGLLILTAVTASGIVLLYPEPKAPDPKKMKPEAAFKYMASKEFSALSDKEKERYFKMMRPKRGSKPPKRMKRPNLTEEERQRLHKNMHKLMRKEMKKRMQEFFAMSKEDQEKFLDKMANDMKERRKNGEGPPGGGGRRGAPSGGRMQGMLENTDSTTRAQMHEFHKRLHQKLSK